MIKLINVKYCIVLFIITIILTTTSCLTFVDPEFKGVEDVRFGGLNDGSVTIDIDVRIKNPNSISFKIVKVDMSLFINNVELGEVVVTKNIKLKKKSDEIYTFPIKASIKKNGGKLLGTLMGVMAGKKPKVKFDGFVKARALGITKKVKIEHGI